MKIFKLSLMMLLQFMMLPVWFVPMMPYVQSLPDGMDWAMWCGLIMGFGTFTSPLFGMFADRLMNAEKVLSICNFVGALLLVAAFFASSAAVLFWLLLATMFFYMPTWSLVAAIAMTNTSTESFARIRTFGTIGWVASGIFSIVGVKCFGIENFDLTHWIFAGGAALSVAGGILALFLPSTEPAQKDQPVSIVDALGLRALVLFKEAKFRNFMIILFLAMVPFQWYNVYCAAYMKEAGFRYLTLTINLGQVGEIIFMLFIPWILKKVGYKIGIVLGLLCIVFRYVCFLCSATMGVTAFDFGAILVHGLIFGLVIVCTQMFVNDNVPKELRSQAQGLVMLIAAGIGVFASNFLFDVILGPANRWTTAYIVALAVAVFTTVLALLLLKDTPKKNC